MIALNLKLLCNNPDIESFYKYERIFSKRDNIIQQRDYEMDCLKQFVSQINLNIDCWDSFYYSFVIPQIMKEFDILRFCKEFILNIELKSDEVPINDIRKQLIRNKYYLMHLEKELFLYSVIIKDNKIISLYKLDDEDLIPVELEELREIIKKYPSVYKENLDKFFNPSEFLVSPINNPEKFISGNYFLTPHQEEIKLAIKEKVNSGVHFHPIITGKAGSGKTLLIYDMAKEIANSGKLAIIIHVGLKDSGHNELERLIPNFKIFGIKEYKNIETLDFQTIFIDESQRLYVYQLKQINKICKERNKVCVFSLDPEQLLNRAEVQAGVAKFLSQQRGNYKLKDKIRTNKELSSFIKALFNLPREIPNVQYKNINLEFCNSEEEVKKVLKFYNTIGFEYISHTPSRLVPHKTLDSFSTTRTSHRVIGQEFTKVVVLLDNDFFYTPNGELTGVEHPCPDYMYRGLLFQEVTRARERLCIIILRNTNVYKTILAILNGEKFNELTENCNLINSNLVIEEVDFD